MSPWFPVHRRIRRLPPWLAVVALLLHLLLPGLHDHHAHHHAGDGACHHVHAAGPTCRCADHRRPSAPPVVVAAAAAGPCLACAFELANPGGDALRSIAVPTHRAARAAPTRRVDTARPSPRCQHHSARAPPGPMPERRS